MSWSPLFEWRHQMPERTMLGAVHTEATAVLAPNCAEKSMLPNRPRPQPPSSRGSDARPGKVIAMLKEVLSKDRVLGAPPDLIEPKRFSQVAEV